MYVNILDASMRTSAKKFNYLTVLWSKKRLLALVVEREDGLVIFDAGLSLGRDSFMSLPCHRLVKHWATSAGGFTSQSCPRPEAHGGCVMGTDTKTPAPQLWPSFSQSDLACGSWRSPSARLCVCLCSLPSANLCFPTGTFPAQITLLIFLQCYFHPHLRDSLSSWTLFLIQHERALAQGIWHWNDVVGLMLSCWTWRWWANGCYLQI